MASAFVFPATPEQAAPAAGGGLSVTYSVAFGLDSGGVDLDVVTVVVSAGDSAATITSRLSAAVSARATERGYAVAKSAITLPGQTKG